MADNISEKLQSILSNPDTLNMFSSLLSQQNSSDENNVSDSSDNDEFISNIQNAVSRINNGTDRRINLLNALRPYMRQTRADGIDKAVKMLKLAQLTSVFKDI